MVEGALEHPGIHEEGERDPGQHRREVGEVAAATGGRYFFGQGQRELEAVYATLDRITPANQKTLSWRPKRELFHYPLGLAVALLLLYQLVMLLGTAARRARMRAHARAEEARA